MKELNKSSLSQTLEKLPTSELDIMLRAELEKELPDEYAVRLILKVLREREQDYPIETNAQIEQAWEKYERKTAPKEVRGSRKMLKAAAVLIVAGLLLFALPQEVKAETFFDRIAAWTDSIFALFSPGEKRAEQEYVFQTDNPGLQELYDTVTAQGVTVPVVPMWLEDGYVLDECKVTNTPIVTRVTGTFLKKNSMMTFESNIYSQNVAKEYHKNEPDAEQYEKNGIIHDVFQNEELWTVVWTRDNVECSLAIDCQEDVLYRILNSIYSVEE